MIPNRCPAWTSAPARIRTDEPAGQDADDLSADDRLPEVVDPDFIPLVLGGRRPSVRRQESPGAVNHPRDPPAHRDPIDVHVERRQEDAHLPPLPPAAPCLVRPHPQQARRGRQPGRRPPADRPVSVGPGPRKKSASSTPSNASAAAQPGRRAANSTAAGTKAPAMNGNPGGIDFDHRSWSRGPGRVLADGRARGLDHGLDSDVPVTPENVFHLVLHLKLAFL